MSKKKYNENIPQTVHKRFPHSTNYKCIKNILNRKIQYAGKRVDTFKLATWQTENGNEMSEICPKPSAKVSMFLLELDLDLELDLFA